jgi:ppGpp synthetase/RelA/SpoT-type nucleotidyltranferase
MFAVCHNFKKSIKQFTQRCDWIKEQPPEYMDKIKKANDEFAKKEAKSKEEFAERCKERIKNGEHVSERYRMLAGLPLED